tara:strand:+ start:526 stop:738 length:213 start_codon:yes stop_codon:yes gene_type:complete
MKKGDLVRWIGFPGASIHPSRTGPTSIGIVVKIWKSSYNEHDKRVDVLWGTGKLGSGLYPQTLEVINECR